jgi:hypothetical protein
MTATMGPDAAPSVCVAPTELGVGRRVDPERLP